MPTEVPLQALSPSELNVIEALFHAGHLEAWNAAEIARGHRRPPRENPDEKLLMAKETAASAAERLVQRRFVEVEMKLGNRRAEPSPHFRLVGGTKEMVGLLTAYLRQTEDSGNPNRAYTLLSSPYAARWISQDLVRAVMAFRGAAIYIPLPIGPRDLEFQGLRSSDLRFEPQLVAVPIRRPDRTPREAANAWMTDNAASVPDAHRAEIERLLVEHYEVHETRIIVMPLLALASISPLALRIFLEPWSMFESPQRRIHRTSISLVEHLLFAMVYASMYDVARTRLVVGPYVSRVAVNPRNGLAEGSGLLSLRLRTGDLIHYSAGFNAPIVTLPGPTKMLPMPANPVDGWASAKWEKGEHPA